MILTLKNLKTPDPTSIAEAAARTMITYDRECSGPAEASARTGIDTAEMLAQLIELLHKKKRLSDADVLELMPRYEEYRP